MSKLIVKSLIGLVLISLLGACTHNNPNGTTVQGLKAADTTSAAAPADAEGCGMKDCGCKDCNCEHHACGSGDSCGCSHKTAKTQVKKVAKKKTSAPKKSAAAAKK